MKKFVLYFLLLTVPFAVHAQFDKLKDSVVELYGVVMTADSLKAIPLVSIVVKGRNQGTYTNDQGVFSIVVMKGEQIEFSSVGYKPYTLIVPDTFHGNQYSVVQLMVTDAQYLPATVIRARPTREQFERDSVKRRILARGLPASSGEAAATYLRQSAQRYYYQGQAPPMNIFNPVAWAD